MHCPKCHFCIKQPQKHDECNENCDGQADCLGNAPIASLESPCHCPGSSYEKSWRQKRRPGKLIEMHTQSLLDLLFQEHEETDSNEKPRPGIEIQEAGLIGG